ncbi:cyclophane-forming radical SAM/SPASM peptide maturase GrrM/OscB [Bradyrhizobium sp. 1050_B9_N1_2]|uniref:cyclophane-forming radical SAM/SPASM peptide maturase GrrM/OscB n=1 Tax=Bradyrhizobium sp. 1050_B9_N1_2 TaxID=3238688 RepID=UPI003EDBB45F
MYEGTCRLLVLQATPFCNIDCTYCYLPERSRPSRMDELVLRAIGQKVLAGAYAADDLSVLWHAGEPLVLPPVFYRDAFNILERFRPPQVDLKHCMQSNGTLITEEWCALFRDHRVEIGVSVDGPQELHDRHRLSRSGEGTFRKTAAGISQLKAFGIPFHVIAVLTRESLSAPEQLFDFFEEMQPTRVHFNVEEIEGANRTSSLNFGDAANEVARFFDSYWNLIEQRNSSQRVREIHDTVGAVLEHAKGREISNYLATPFSCISISCDGDLSTFSPELLSQRHAQYGNFVFGNIVRQEMDFIEQDVRLAEVRSAINRGNERCKLQCDYYPVCGGASPSNKLSENGSFDSTETLFCKLRVMTLTDIVLARMAAATKQGGT